MSTETFGAVNKFLTKTAYWAFCPPSDNLWTVRINLYNDGSGSGTVYDLYKNISIVNAKWSSLDKWKVEGDSSLAQLYFTEFTDDGGIFLAQAVNVDSISLTVNNSVHSQIQGSSGFLTFGDALSSKNSGLSCNIDFLSSNYDIHDLLIDRWIAAIGQQGLIESSDSENFPNIKADIYIYNYAASTPNGIGYTLRKTIKVSKAYPVSREQSSATYDFNEAGSFKSKVVKFNFENYTISYNSEIKAFSK